MQKVLILTYYWPPAGGPGVQRWLKFVKYLPEFGIEPILYVPENPSYPIIDHKLVEEIPEGITVLQKKIREPHRWASLLSKSKTQTISRGMIAKKKQGFLEKILLWVRGNLFIPDARVAWVKPSLDFLGSYLQEHKIETVITTGPPHSVHLIGLGLKDQLDIRWIADFRDPWTSIGYHEKLRLSKASQQKHKDLERKVLSSADQIVVTSQATRSEFKNITSKPIEVVTNGYEDNPYTMALDEDFTIAHIGSLLTDRNPTQLWEVLGALVRTNKVFAEKLKIQLVGVIGAEVKESLADHGLGDYVDFKGYLNHQEVLQLQQKAQILLLLEIDSAQTAGIIPGKLFEYFAARRPILAIGPKEWEAGIMVQETESGTFLTPEDTTELNTVLLEWFSQYQEKRLVASPKNIEQYHRRQLTETLANIIRWESS
ncbi:MAG: glycosyltransferase family 4 protein [Bacteroidota bacterium]